MNRSEHERARDLVLTRDVEGIDESDRTWLESHVGACPECAAFAEDLHLTSRALRSIPVMASTSLVSSTQARVRQRAAELREQQARVFLIGISFGLGLLWSAGSAFVGWKISGWLAERIHVAPLIISAAFVVFWLAPAMVMAVAGLLYRPISHHAWPDWLAARVEGDWQ
jgi:anti-sigma factor RsiW